MARVEQQRERLELEDFEVPDGETFDPVAWLNGRLARSGGVGLDRLDQHLSLLGMSCQLLCQDTSESIEVACNQLVATLPSTSRDLGRMQEEVLGGRGRLGEVLEGLKDADERKRSGLHGLAEIDVVKQRVEMACGAVREVGSWERRVLDCEQHVHSGGLPSALSQLTSLREVLDAFRMLPEYGKKEEQLQQLEESLLRAARRKARVAMERNVVADLRACCEVLTGLGSAGEPVALATTVFQELAEKAWQGHSLRTEASAGEVSAAARAVFEAFAPAFEERREMFQLLDELAPPAAASGGAGAGGGPADASQAATPGTARSRAAVIAARAALVVLGSKVEAVLVGGVGPAANEEVSLHARSGRVVAVLAAYVDGIEAFSKGASVAESPDLLAAICQPSGDVEVLPWGVLREVTRCAVLRPMQDEALALAPSAHGNMRPSEAVLAAESSAKRLFQMVGAWAQRLEQQGIANLGVAWLACVDETCGGFWRQWDTLFETFRNTMDQKSGQEAGGEGAEALQCTFDASLLNECMQLHGMLHDSIPAAFADFRGDALQMAVHMATSKEPAFGRMIAEKLRDPSVWCAKLALPSAASLEAAHAAVLGNAGATQGSGSGALPVAAAGLAAAEKEGRDIVTRCCVQPVSSFLSGYPEESQWLAEPAAGELPNAAASLLPLQRVTAVGEHLFSLVPHLERSHDSSQYQWLPTVLEAVVEATVEQALKIRKLSLRGAEQLIVDLGYVQKVTDALGSSSGDAPSVAETGPGTTGSLAGLLEVLEFLVAQQRRKQECVAAGEAFVEAARECPPAGRRFERVLRPALGFERSQA